MILKKERSEKININSKIPDKVSLNFFNMNDHFLLPFHTIIYKKSELLKISKTEYYEPNDRGCLIPTCRKGWKEVKR